MAEEGIAAAMGHPAEGIYIGSGSNHKFSIERHLWVWRWWHPIKALKTLTRGIPKPQHALATGVSNVSLESR